MVIQKREVYRLPLQNRDRRAKCAKKETKRSRREKTIKNGERGSRKVWGDTRGDVIIKGWEDNQDH